MSAARILTGPRFNFLSRALAITLSPDAADPLFPSAGLYDDRPATICKFNAATANEQILVDLNHILNGNMEGGFVAGVATSWTKAGAGACTSEGTIVHGGTAAQKINSAAGNGTNIFQMATLRPGESFKATVWGATGAGSATVFLIIQNELTQNYWNGAAWTSVFSDCARSNSSSYVQLSTTSNSPVVETSPLMLWYGTARLRMWLQVNVGGASTSDTVGYFDDAEIFPAVDTAALFWHNLDPALVVNWASGATTSAFTTQSVMSVLPISFYSVLATPTFARYWLMQFVGTQIVGGTPGTVTPIWFGEYVLGQSTALLRQNDYNLVTKHHEFQNRVVSQVGDQYVYVLGGGPTRTLTIAIAETAATEYKQFRDAIMRHSRLGRDSCVLIPWDADPDVCVYGRFAPDVTETRELLTWWRNAGSVQEAAAPVVF